MGKLVIFFGIFMLFLQAQNTVPYYALAEPLGDNARKIEQLNNKVLSASDAITTVDFCSDVQKTLSKGAYLATSSVINEDALSLYLLQLRSLSLRQEQIYQLYRKSILHAIDTKDKKRFEQLASIELEPLHQPRVRSDVIAFYQKNFPEHSILNLENLSKEQALEVKSIQFAQDQEQAYEEHLKILKRSQVQQLKKTTAIGSRNSVMIIAETTPKGGVVFEAENLNPYRVTLTLDIASISNLSSTVRLPLSIELAGYSKKSVLELVRLDSTKLVNYQASYGWVRGSSVVRHNDDYLYTLPFAKGTGVYVSQGYNGGLSHKGLTAYAIDFPLPVGTPVYAAREGIVVGAEGSNSLGGASPEYRRYANYVIIEHDDGTMGNYYHLRQGGTAVKIGEKVKKGQLIAYSGNTGYTSGAHLHFSVSTVDPVSMRRPMNLPVKIQTAQGIVTNPRQGDRYTVL